MKLRTRRQMAGALITLASAIGLSAMTLAQPDAGAADPATRPLPADRALLRDAFGISVHPLARDMATPRGLPPGVGLVIDEIAPNSLAAKAGLIKGDILFQAAEQWIVNPQQLLTVLSIQEADEDFELQVHRGNRPVELELELDKATLDDLDRRLDQAALAPIATPSTQTGSARPPYNPLMIPETLAYSDDQHTIDIRTHDGVKRLTVKDRDGNAVYDGPYSTAAERERVPGDVKEKVERILRERDK